jgi:hypothetical protein
VTTDDETVIHMTPDAAWLPRHGRAEVVRRRTPPRPMSVVRLLLRQNDRVWVAVGGGSALRDRHWFPLLG